MCLRPTDKLEFNPLFHSGGLWRTCWSIYGQWDEMILLFILLREVLTSKFKAEAKSWDRYQGLAARRRSFDRPNFLWVQTWSKTLIERERKTENGSDLRRKARGKYGKNQELALKKFWNHRRSWGEPSLWPWWFWPPGWQRFGGHRRRGAVVEGIWWRRVVGPHLQRRPLKGPANHNMWWDR